MTGNDVPTGSVGNTHIQPLTSTFFSTLEKNFLPFRYDSHDNVFFLLGLLRGFSFSFLNFHF